MYAVLILFHNLSIFKIVIGLVKDCPFAGCLCICLTIFIPLITLPKAAKPNPSGL